MMRLSESLHKSIMESTVGRLLNKFKVRRRRTTLFFEDILANYIKNCEDAGFRNVIRNIGIEYGYLGTKCLVSDILRKLSPTLFFNTIAKKVWNNIGLLEDLHVTKEDNVIEIETSNEFITRVIGKNNFIIGSCIGMLNLFYASQVEFINAKQTKKSSKYIFELINKPISVFEFKEKTVYNKLNYSQVIEGFTLKDSIRMGIFQLKEGNRIYFRGKSILPIENTLFHLLSNSRILSEKIQNISYKYFNKIIEKNVPRERKLILLKNLLQIMGWGIIRIIDKTKNEIIVEIENPPYGIQKRRDNWDFIIRTVLGYLWLVDKDFKITDIKESYKFLSIKYSR